MYPGDVALCPPGVKHWHGGSADTEFAHIAANTNPELTGLEWFDRISAEEYGKLSQDKKENSASEEKTLIVYFSWSSSGNTEKMAKMIQEQTGGDILKLEPLNPYPEDYTECTEVALAERDGNVRPEIKNLPESLEGYDRIFIGYPIWLAYHNLIQCTQA